MRPQKTTTQLALTAILLLGAALRLGAFHEALIGADQASILAAAADIVALRDLPGVGIKSSVGVMQTAAVAYLGAIPLLLVHRVIAISWFFAALDCLALAALIRAVRRTLGLRAAAIAALLYATSPWIIEFNRWIWYQSLIPTFSTVTFAALLTMVGRQPVDTAPSRGAREGAVSTSIALVGATLTGLVHLAAAPWALLVGVASLVVALRKGWWRAAVLGLVLAAVIAAPYVRFLTRGGVADVEALLTTATTTDGDAGLNTAAYRLAFELQGGQQILSTPRNALWANTVLWCDAATWVVPTLVAAATLWAVVQLVRRRLARAALLALAWSLAAPTLFLPTSVHLQHFYLLFIFPAPFVLVGAMVEGWWLAGNARSQAARLAASTVLVIATLVAAWWSHLWFVRIGYEQQGRLRAPTRAWLMDETAATVGAYLDAHPEGEVIILTAFDGGGLSPFDWLRNWLNTDRVRAVPSSTGLIIPAGETCYLLGERANPQRLAPVLDRATDRPEMMIPASPPWTFTCIGPRPSLLKPMAEWENGLALVTAEVGGELVASGLLELTLVWHYEALTGEAYHFFHHLLHDGELVAQVDGDGVPSRYWRDDDLFITQWQLPLPSALPPGSYTLRVGSYAWPDLSRTLLNNGDDGLTVATWER